MPTKSAEPKQRPSTPSFELTKDIQLPQPDASAIVLRVHSCDGRRARHAVEDQAEAQAAMERLNITLHMLDTEAEQTPGIRKSVDIIRDQIAQIGPKVPKQDDAQPILFDQSTSQSLEHPVSPPVSIQSGLNDMSTGPAASFQQSDSSGILPNLAQPTLQYVDQQLFPQQYDPMLSVQGFENMGICRGSIGTNMTSVVASARMGMTIGECQNSLPKILSGP